MASLPVIEWMLRDVEWLEGPNIWSQGNQSLGPQQCIPSGSAAIGSVAEGCSALLVVVSGFPDLWQLASVSAWLSAPWWSEGCTAVWGSTLWGSWDGHQAYVPICCPHSVHQGLRVGFCLRAAYHLQGMASLGASAPLGPSAVVVSKEGGLCPILLEEESHHTHLAHWLVVVG